MASTHMVQISTGATPSSNSAVANTDKRKVGFLSLPPEVRKMVYKLSIKKTTPYMWDSRPAVCAKNPEPDLSDFFRPGYVIRPHCAPDKSEDWDSRFKRWDGKCRDCDKGEAIDKQCWHCNKDGLALLYTCRRVYIEAIKVVYEHSRFRLMYESDMLSFVRAMYSHGHGHLVRRLEFQFLFLNGDGDLDEIIPFIRGGALRRAFPKLERLTIYFSQEHNKWADYFADDSHWYWPQVVSLMKLLMDLLYEYTDLKVRVTGLLSREIEELIAHSLMQHKWLLPEDTSAIVDAAKIEYNADDEGAHFSRFMQEDDMDVLADVDESDYDPDTDHEFVGFEWLFAFPRGTDGPTNVPKNAVDETADE